MLCGLALIALLAPATALQPSGSARLESFGRSPTVRASRSPMVRAVIEAAPPEGFTWATFATTDDVAPSASIAPVDPAPSASIAPVDPSKIVIEADAASVGANVWARVNKAAAQAIADRGHFALGIPGGSVLKMLQGDAPWASSTTLAYVNHKCVAMDDAALATHAKAMKGFMETWTGLNAIVLSGSADAPAEAEAYEEALKALPEDVLPRDANGMPVFDMMLIGVGDDGHVGSLYPGRDEVLDKSGGWVLPVEMKQPGSITLSLPVMAGAKEVLIAACGVSEKYPMGKSEAMARGIEGDETPSTFPAVGLRGVATWILDTAAAGALGVDYADCFSLTMSRGDCNPPP